MLWDGHVAPRREKKCAWNFGSKTWEIDTTWKTCVYVRIILKWALKRWNGLV